MTFDWGKSEMGGAIAGGGSSKNAMQNVAIGGALQVFEVSTLGQPFEVIKTHMAGIVPVYLLSLNWL